MRVIAGEFRSRVLKEVDATTTRETKDRVKESIFNSINNYIPESICLDLFAGSGSLGIEAISRGASFVDFVDHNLEAYKTTLENINTLKIKDRVTLSKNDYNEFLKNTTKSYDLIFLDPPYHLEKLNDIIKVISDNKLLKEDGIIICLYSKNISIKDDVNGIIEYKQKKIGITKVSFMKWGI